MSLPPDDLQLAELIWNYMVVDDQPKKADVIIGLGCHDMSVADDAARLYHDGIAPLIVFSGKSGRMTEGLFPDSEARMMRGRALTLGVPETAIRIEEESTNTGENIRFSQQLLRSSGINPGRITLVHKPYMQRRDYATFMKQWESSESVELTCWASQSDCRTYIEGAADPAEEIAIMVGDVQRMRRYYEMGFQIEQSIPYDAWAAYEQLVARGYDGHLLR